MCLCYLQEVACYEALLPLYEIMARRYQFLSYFCSCGLILLHVLQPYKVRRRDEWKKWVCTPSRFAAGSGFQSTMGSTEKTITSSLLKITLDEAATNESSIMSEADSSAKVVPRTSKSEEFTGHSNLANGETMIEASCSSHIWNIVASKVCAPSSYMIIGFEGGRGTVMKKL